MMTMWEVIWIFSCWVKSAISNLLLYKETIFCVSVIQVHVILVMMQCLQTSRAASAMYVRLLWLSFWMMKTNTMLTLSFEKKYHLKHIQFLLKKTAGWTLETTCFHWTVSVKRLVACVIDVNLYFDLTLGALLGWHLYLDNRARRQTEKSVSIFLSIWNMTLCQMIFIREKRKL